MPYIGKSPTGTGVRSRYYFTATGGETSLSGASDSGATLSFTDGNYVDVSLNGVALVAGTDYNTTTANTIGGLTALSASDIVEILVYDIFTVADTVPASSGGTFSGNVAMGGTLSVTGASTATGGLNVGTIKEATGTTTAMTIDSSGHVLAPVNPKFSVYLNTTTTANNYTSTSTSNIEFDTEEFDVGGCVAISSNVATFTAPVTGYYQFNLIVQLDEIDGAGHANTYLSIDGSTTTSARNEDYRLIEDPQGGTYVTLVTSALIYLTATQTVNPKLFINGDTSVKIRVGTRFSGFLVP